MDEKLKSQMAKMVDPVQPHCDEPIIAAMTCSHAGSMKAALFSKFIDDAGGNIRTSDLPNPVMLAAGKTTIYAFKYKPFFFKFKIKKEVGRWAKDQVEVTSEETRNMCYFVLNSNSGERYAFEIPIMMGGQGLAHMFLKAIGDKTQA